MLLLLWVPYFTHLSVDKSILGDITQHSGDRCSLSARGLKNPFQQMLTKLTKYINSAESLSEYFLRYSRNFYHFIESERSLPWSQRPCTVPYLSYKSLVHTFPSLKPILILSSHLCLVFRSSFVPSGFPTKLRHWLNYVIHYITTL
jgi:hypothetical protein